MSIISTQIKNNIIINGEMVVAQRGTSFTSIADTAYSLDRWVYNKSGDMVHNITQDTDSPTVVQVGITNPYSLKLACTTIDASIGATDLVILSQRVEGYNILNCVNGYITLSFWIKAYKTGTYCVAFRNNGRDRSYVAEYTINASNTWEKKTLTVNLNYSGGTWDYTTSTGLDVSFVIAAGSNYQTTANAWQTGNYLCSSNQVNGVDNTNDTVNITDVKLEKGSVATKFEKNRYDDVLRCCQRYYRRYGQDAPGNLNGIAFKGYTTAGSYCSESYTIPQMRIAPTNTIYGTWNKTNVSNIFTLGSSPSTFALQYQATSDGAISVYTDSADDYIELNAEL